jgi:N-acetylglucosaminyldiphosphoundecaprenol N-acetyl-beta-D-mannosaminyltransferase
MTHTDSSKPGLPTRLALRALDVLAGTVLLAVALPSWPGLAVACRLRSGRRIAVSIGAPGQSAWVFNLRPTGRFGIWLVRSPLALALLSGRFALVGGGAWRLSRPVPAPLKPGLITLDWIRGFNGIARGGIDALDRELAAGFGLGAVVRLLAKTPIALLLSGRGGAPTGRFILQQQSLTNASMSQLIATLLGAARSGRRLLGCFLNADCVNIAARDADYRAALRHPDAVHLPDGIGVRLAASLTGQPMDENLVGTDLLPALCDTARGANSRKLYFLGARPGVAAAAADTMRAQFPGVDIVGARDGYFRRNHAEEDAVIAAINASGAEILLVGFGAPHQERWMAANADRLRPRVILGVGGLFDYYGGRVQRAPLWVRELGGEWAWRLAMEPRRLARRYLIGNAIFLLRLLRRAVSPWHTRHSAAANV